MLCDQNILQIRQVKGCIIKYESENVIEEVQIINNETLIFPSVTMCNRWNQTFKYILKKFLNQENKNRFPFCFGFN